MSIKTRHLQELSFTSRFVLLLCRRRLQVLHWRLQMPLGGCDHQVGSLFSMLAPTTARSASHWTLMEDLSSFPPWTDAEENPDFSSSGHVFFQFWCWWVVIVHPLFLPNCVVVRPIREVFWPVQFKFVCNLTFAPLGISLFRHPHSLATHSSKYLSKKWQQLLAS